MKSRSIVLCVAGAVLITLGSWWIASLQSSDSSRSGEGKAVASTLENLGDRPAGDLAAEGVDSAVTGGVAAALPAGTVIDADEYSWAPDGIGGGTMRIVVTRPGSAPNDYLAVVVDEAGAWKVLATVDIE